MRENNKFKKILIGKNVSSISPMFKLINYAGTVEISEENPYYTIENNILYSKNKKTLICALYQITGSFTVPGTVENIGNLAFDVQGMQEVILESGVKKIDSAGSGGKVLDLLDELLASLKPSKEYLYKQRLKRKMQREAMR